MAFGDTRVSPYPRAWHWVPLSLWDKRAPGKGQIGPQLAAALLSADEPRKLTQTRW